MDCSFSFGPNRSYIMRVGTGWWAYSDDPTPPAYITRILTDAAHPQAWEALYDVALAMEPDVFYMAWQGKGRKSWLEWDYLGDAYARLTHFVKSPGTWPTTRTTFGPNRSYFSISPSGCSWQNLPSKLEEDIIMRSRIHHPTAVALGVDGSYVVVYNDGSAKYDLRGMYPLVKALFDEARGGGVKYVALNPFIPGEYYAVCLDGSTSWNLPKAWATDVCNSSERISATGGTSSHKTPLDWRDFLDVGKTIVGIYGVLNNNN
ncbi:hypothetical protein DFH09DRAFT_1194478 [Mycena vulgaris]|nr:hypothetical protein DFH09DRAFT_1194478 [Mycena vulgaris]